MLPDFHQLAVKKSDITEPSIFKDLIALYNLKIVYNEPDYYILDGTTQDLYDFQKYWRDA